MKNRKKIPLLVLIMVVIMVFSACNGQIVSNSSSVSTTSPEETTQETTSTDATEVDTQENTEKQETSSASENTISENSISENSVSENEIAIAYKTFDEAKTMYVISPVNVRKGPSTDYDIVSHLATQQEVKVTGQADNNGWYQIMIDNEQAYVSNHYLSDTLIETPPAPQTAAANAPQKQKTPSEGGTIMVGDSRFVQMQTAVSGGGCAWVCENSKGYDWFVEKAIPRIDAAVGKGTRIVINLGVNDPGNVKKYAETVNAKAAEWVSKGASVYYVSVNPVWENPYTTEEQVTTFNSTMPSLLSGVGWIDTHSWLITNGYRVVDGLHYDDPTYVNIYNLIMGSI